MCAECHSTGVRKNYDAVKDRFATTWAEIIVGCEACQGSNHVAWARDKQNYADGFQAAWTDKPDAEKLLTEIAANTHAPAVARASALTELASRLSPSNLDLARTGLSDPDPMVRIGALDMLENVSRPDAPATGYSSTLGESRLASECVVGPGGIEPPTSRLWTACRDP
jgi:hypothetical protein